MRGRKGYVLLCGIGVLVIILGGFLAFNPWLGMLGGFLMGFGGWQALTYNRVNT